MRIICDTNVIISGILFGGNSRAILSAVSRSRIDLYSSPALLEELRGVLSRPKFALNPARISAIIALLHETASIVYPQDTFHVIHEDPDDDRVLEAAWAAQAEMVISGDQHLLSLKEWKGIRIINPADFCVRYLPDTLK